MNRLLETRSPNATAVLVASLAVAASAAVLLPTPGPARALAVLAFGLLAPGAAIAGLLRIRAAAPWLMITVAGSLAVEVVLSELAVLAGWWEPRALLLVSAAACIGAALAMSDREGAAA